MLIVSLFYNFNFFFFSLHLFSYDINISINVVVLGKDPYSISERNHSPTILKYGAGRKPFNFKESTMSLYVSEVQQIIGEGHLKKKSRHNFTEKKRASLHMHDAYRGNSEAQSRI